MSLAIGCVSYLMFNFATDFGILVVLSASVGIFTVAITILNLKVVQEIWELSYLPFALGSTKMALGLGYLIGPPLLAMIMAVSSDQGTNSLYTTAALFGIASLLAFVCYFVNKRHNF